VAAKHAGEVKRESRKRNLRWKNPSPIKGRFGDRNRKIKTRAKRIKKSSN